MAHLIIDGRLIRDLSLCDKCGKKVPPSNDVARFEMIFTSDPAFVLMPSRHLLPTEGCEGSPSRAQYIEGQPRDKRSAYPYQPQFEAAIRAVWSEMQREYHD